MTKKQKRFLKSFIKGFILCFIVLYFFSELYFLKIILVSFVTAFFAVQMLNFFRLVHRTKLPPEIFQDGFDRM